MSPKLQPVAKHIPEPNVSDRGKLTSWSWPVLVKEIPVVCKSLASGSDRALQDRTDRITRLREGPAPRDPVTAAVVWQDQCRHL